MVLLVLGGGFLAADRLATASTGLSTGAFETTVEKVVTVREHGKTIVKSVPVVRRVSQTLLDTRVITTPGGVRIVERNACARSR